MAVATSAMLRTWPVRLLAMKFTLSVKSFHVPPTPGTCAWPPSLPSVPTSRATRVTSPANALSWSTIVLMVSFSSRISPFTSTVILRDRSPRATAVVTSAMLRTCAVRFPAIAFTESVRSFHVPATPGTTACPPSFAVGAHFARHARHFRRERPQLIHHRVDGFLQLQNFAAHVHRDLAREVAAGHRRGHFGDVAHLAGQVAGHRVHGIGQVLPRAGDAGHLRLSAQLAVRAHFARHARHFRREHAELLNHGVDDGGRAQEFAFQRPSIDVQPHRLRQIALRHRGDRARHFGRRPQQIIDQRVDRNFHLAPRRLGQVKSHALARSAFLAHHLPDALQFLRHLLVGRDDVVERVGDFSGQPGPGPRQAHGEIAVAHGLQACQDYAQIGGHRLGFHRRRVRPLLFALGLGSGIVVVVVLLGSVRFILLSTVQGQRASPISRLLAQLADISLELRKANELEKMGAQHRHTDGFSVTFIEREIHTIKPSAAIYSKQCIWGQTRESVNTGQRTAFAGKV